MHIRLLLLLVSASLLAAQRVDADGDDEFLVAPGMAGGRAAVTVHAWPVSAGGRAAVTVHAWPVSAAISTAVREGSVQTGRGRGGRRPGNEEFVLAMI